MLGSWLLWLTATATVLLVPALVAALRVDQHAHKAPPRGLERRIALVASTTLVAVAALPVAALLGAGGLGAGLVAVVLGVSVLGSARSRDRWAVRAIVARGLLLAGVVAALLWFGYFVLATPTAASAGRVLGGLWGLTAWGAYLLRRPVERWLGARAGELEAREAPVVAFPGRPLLRRTGIALAVFILPAAAIAGGRSAPDPAPPASRAGSEGTATPGTGRSTGSPGEASPSVPGAPGTPVRTADGPTPTGSLTREATPRPRDTESTTLPSPTVTGTGLPSESPSPSPTDGGLPTVLPVPTGWPEESKTPGYAKEKPNRPSDAPSPGSGKD
ncbi:MAG TPA: hypothetical protein VFY11_09950 [Nocardioidaceae bacterium]|nr:hypothetical protein [Nocardioidaceae bacterium]